MTRTVRDAALMLDVCAGPDPRDQYSLPADGVDHVKALKGSLRGLRVAYSDTLGFAPAVDPEVRAATRAAAGEFRKLGCRVSPTRSPYSQAFDVAGSTPNALGCGPSNFSGMDRSITSYFSNSIFFYNNFLI